MQKSHNFYCAFCRSPRRFKRQKHIGVLEILGFAVFTLAASVSIKGDIDPRFVIVYLLTLCMIEVVIQFRWRLAIVCPECGFDPVLYKRNATQACAKVKLHLESRQQQKFGMLAPKLNLPNAPAKPASQKVKPKLLSKRI